MSWGFLEEPGLFNNSLIFDLNIEMMGNFRVINIGSYFVVLMTYNHVTSDSHDIVCVLTDLKVDCWIVNDNVCLMSDSQLLPS